MFFQHNINHLNDLCHYFNAELPDLHGDYVGFLGFKIFFETMAKCSKGTFKVKPVFVTPNDEELVVVPVIDEMVLEDRQVELDSVPLWRVVNGKITEGWDIPAFKTTRLTIKNPNQGTSLNNETIKLRAF